MNSDRIRRASVVGLCFTVLGLAVMGPSPVSLWTWVIGGALFALRDLLRPL